MTLRPARQVGYFYRRLALWAVRVGVVATFALIPVWYRFRGSPASFTAFYSTGFIIFWPMVWTVVWWTLAGLPGLGRLWRDRLRSSWALALVGLTAWAFLSWAWAYTHHFRPEVAVGAAIPLGVAALFAVVTACAGPSARTIVLVLVIGLAWNSGLALAQFARQSDVGLRALGEFPLYPTASGTVVVQAGDIRLLRPYGLMPHPNMLAGFLSIGLMAALAWAASRRAGRWYLGTVVLLAGLWALLLTFSRAALLGLGVGAFAILPHLWRLRGRAGITQLVTTGTLAIVVTVVFVLLYQPFVFARAGGTNESIEMRSVSDRAVYNTLAIYAIHESPALGVGIGNFPWIASYYLAQTNFDLDGQPAHHVMLSAWAELGLVGLGLTAIMLATGVLAALRAVRRETPTEADDNERLARLILLGAVLSLMVTGLLDHYAWTILHFQAAWWAMLGAAGRS